MTTYQLNTDVIHPSWHDCFERGLAAVDTAYLQSLSQSNDWLPGATKIFNAFSLPFDKVNYVLFGESPYPRSESANGYAFWDAAVAELWSPTGLSKKVNRATSLRNIIKMLLIADGTLKRDDATQTAIAAIDKQSYVQTNNEFFTNLSNHGFLLLNATPVLQASGAPQKDARAWLPFMQAVLDCLLEKRPQTQLILLGRIANTIDELIPDVPVNKLYAEHPYNLSFIGNEEVIKFFRPLNLLRR